MKTDREKQSLRGDVKSIRVETAQFKEEGGLLVEVPWFGHSITFNPHGQIVEQVNLNPDGTEWRTTHDYSDSGRLLVTRHYDPSGLPSGEVRYVYDEEGKLIIEQYVAQDGTVTTPTTYAYDELHRKIKIQEFDFSGEANLLIGIEGTDTSIGAAGAKWTETRYDERGEVVEVKVFNAEGVLATRIEITRDDRGNPLEETQYVGETLPFGECSAGVCSTEDVPEITEEQQAEFEAEMARMFAPGTPMSVHAHSYDDEGRLLESRLMMLGMEAGRQTFAYDEFGNRAEEVSYGEGGEFQSKAIFTREYDRLGNWIKEVVSSANAAETDSRLIRPVHITRRFISYY